MSDITMTLDKAMNHGGAIYLGGSGSATIALSDCAATVEYFDSVLDGALVYVYNPSG